jgi:Outer membrane lipoprotein-sorting protein
MRRSFLFLIAIMSFSLNESLAPLTLPCLAKAREVVNFNSAGPLLKNMKEGSALIDTMVQKAEALNDYSLVFETITYKKGETIQEKGKLWFKKPKLMRLEEIGDYQKGSVAVLGKDGKVRAHAGGLIKFVTLTLSPDDKQLDAANGDKMEDSDFISLANILKKRLKQGNLARVSEAPVTAAGVERETLVLELYKADNPKLVLKRIYVDPKSALPVRWDDYDYATPCSSTWTDVKANTNLSDDLFKM